MRLLPHSASRATSKDRETADIVAPGPWIAFGALALGLTLDAMFWIGMLARTPSPLRSALALLLVSFGGWMVFRANVAFRRADTAFQPWVPTSSLATGDVYAWTRNPMYQGFLILVLGLAMLFRSDWTLLLFPAAAMLVHYGVVLREERYLARRFGEPYRAYLAAVPRYGWPDVLPRAARRVRTGACGPAPKAG